MKHLVGNILVLVAQCLSLSLKAWESFARSLFFVLELELQTLLQCPSTFARDVDKFLNGSNPSFIELKTGIKKSSWCTADTLVRVVRNLLKYLKQDHEHQRQQLEVFLVSMTSLLSYMPWECWNKHLFGRDITFLIGNTLENERKNAPLSFMDGGELDPAVAFLGNFVQSICSLVGQMNSFVKENASSVHNSFICLVIGVMPELFNVCLGKHGAPRKDIVAHYLTHKLLMLMLRISSQNQLSCLSALSWLQLLHDYLNDILKKSIVTEDCNGNELLEGSPIIFGGEVYQKYKIHLQRYAILVFLRCCHSNVRSTRMSCQPSICATATSCSSIVFGRNRGFLELHQWVKSYINADPNMRPDINVNNCIDISRSFLWLYLHEDDTMFLVLLELSYLKSTLDQPLREDEETFDEMDDLVFCFDLLFNPTTLFHIFLQEMHYDHQVLVNFLTSKNTGISCAQYLLRSLRAISYSWHIFMQFSSNVHSTLPVSSIHGLSTSSNQESGGLFRQQDNSQRKPFHCAKKCLHSLEKALKSLHSNGLFPYNPKALLRRLKTFREMCINSSKDGL